LGLGISVTLAIAAGTASEKRGAIFLAGSFFSVVQALLNWDHHEKGRKTTWQGSITPLF
jgi:hypothetical protein